jgi:hypothetical protein
MGKADSSTRQAIQIRRINVRITKRSDGIESLLIRHDKQYVGPGQ